MKKISDIKKIEVDTGPGSYTGLRIGVAVASTIAWVLGVKLNGKDIRKGEVIKINYQDRN